MKKFLNELQQKVCVGLVGGSDLAKITEQMNSDSDDGESLFIFTFQNV